MTTTRCTLVLALGALSCLLTLPACTTVQPPAPIGTAAPPAPSRSPLTVERQWLQSWFDGTPVRISQRGGGPVSVEVPLEFCFDRGRSAVKPPLAAVLDKVAESLLRVPRARLELLAAPGDGGSVTRLASQRAARVRSHLLRRGAPASQLGPAATTAAPAVQLRLELAAD